jgi:predicted metal-dependent hydrolase
MARVSGVDNFYQEELFPLTLTDMASSYSNPAKNPAKNGPKNPEKPRMRSTLLAPGGVPIKIIKSKRRKRNIAAYRENGEIVISVPFRTSRAEIDSLVPEMVSRVISNEARSRRSERELTHRGEELMARYLPDFSERASSITWREMSERWGSCTTVDQTIRISQRLSSAPSYVLDYVLFHELIHLRIPGHGEDFQFLLARFEDGARAEAFLEGYEAGRSG